MPAGLQPNLPSPKDGETVHLHGSGSHLWFLNTLIGCRVCRITFPIYFCASLQVAGIAAWVGCGGVPRNAAMENCAFLLQLQLPANRIKLIITNRLVPPSTEAFVTGRLGSALIRAGFNMLRVCWLDAVQCGWNHFHVR